MKILTNSKLFFKIALLLTLLVSNSLNATTKNHVEFSISRIGQPSLDPHSSQGDLELHLNPNIFDALYKINPSNGKLIPALATSHRWITPKIIEFNLRKNVTFHNGEKFDAQSVKYSYERMLSIQNGFNWIKAIIPTFKKIEIIDPYKIRIHFTKHNSIFLISNRFFIILPPKYLKDKGIEHFKKYPIGTGAFKVKKISYKNKIISTIHLEKFNNYWDKNYPKLDSVNYNFNLNQKESLVQFIDGKLNAVADIPIRSLLSVKKSGNSIEKKGQGLLTWVYFNLTKYKKNSPIYDKNVRKAILHAIDYKKIKELVYKNHANTNHQWAFPNLPGYSKELKNYQYDLKKAQELLKNANIKDQITLNIYCDDVSMDEAKIIKSSLKKIGIKVNIDILDENTNNCILTSKNNQDSKCHNKLKHYDFMIGDFGWGLPHNYVSALHTFSQKSFASLLDKNHPSANISTMMFDNAIETFSGSDKKWEDITIFEYKRLAISSLFLKDVFYAKDKKLIWDVYGSYEFTKAYYK